MLQLAPRGLVREERARRALTRAGSWVALGFLALTLASAPAQASVVARERVTLGALADWSDVVVMARVRSGPSAQDPAARLRVLVSFKGSAQGSELRLPMGPHVRVHAGERAVFFLRRGRQGLRPLVTPYQAVEVKDSNLVELVRVVRGRMPSVGGSGALAADALARALFLQLESRVPRVAEDAAWDLLKLRRAQPNQSERAILERVLANAPSEPVLHLAQRWPAAGLYPHALRIGERSSDPRLRALAGTALQAIDGFAAADRARQSLAGADLGGALRGVALAESLPGDHAKVVLLDALNDARPDVREGALRALGRRALTDAEVARVEAHALNATSQAEHERALGVLARASAGRALARLETQHPDAGARELASALRSDPVRLGRRLLR